uniref:Fibroblast growth factor n=1 Tax=Strigamia maritima TaxID=126957 RepID=T1JCE8_STRMM
MGPCCSRDITEDIEITHRPSGKMTDMSGSSCPCPPPSTSESNISDAAATGGDSSRNHWGSIKQLYCRTGFHLIIKRNMIKGTRKPYHKNGSDENEEGTVFVEAYQDGWNTYLSRKYAHFGWYLAINKVGKARAGHKTSFNHKSIMFLPRSAFSE